MRSSLRRFLELLVVLTLLCPALARLAAAAPDPTPLKLSTFQAKGTAMGDWRWLGNESGTGTIAWTFSDKRIPEGDIELRFSGLAAFPPGSAAVLELRLHYGQPGSGSTAARLAEASVTLSPTGASAPVGTPVAGTLVITQAQLAALAPGATKLVVRLNQVDNQDLSVAFVRQGLVALPSSDASSGEQSETGGGAGEQAATYASNGDLIQGWHWLRDAGLRHYATWRFDDIAVPANGLSLNFTFLATDRVSGGPGVAASFALRYGADPSVLEGRGGQVVAVSLVNVSPPGDTLGYLNQGSLRLPAAQLGGAGQSTALYLRVERLSAKGPHIAVRAIAITIGNGGTTTGGETSDGGTTDEGTTGGGATGDGTAGGGTTGGGTTGTGGDGTLTLTLSDGGRRVQTSLPFLLPSGSSGGANDPDKDGLRQDFEDALLARVAPKVELDEEEDWLTARPTDRVVHYGRVMSFPSRTRLRFIIVNYATAWSRDYGRFAVGIDAYDKTVAIRHNGDVERVVEAWEVIDDHTLELRYVFTSAHGDATLHSGVWAARGSSCNEGKVVLGVDQTLCSELSFDDGHVLLQASEDKHAYYPSAATCEAVRLVFRLGTGFGEDCGGGGRFLFPVVNAGEPGAHLVDSIGDTFAHEFVWTTDQFCGGDDGSYNRSLPCVGAIGPKLASLPDMLEPMLPRIPKTIAAGTGELYEHRMFGGFSVGFRVGSSERDMTRYQGQINLNDVFSSLKLGSGIACTFYADVNFGGQHLGPVTAADAVDGEWRDLSTIGWNDRISSFVCAGN